ncbi:serine/threonine protein phosphatase [Shimia sp. R10_1]|nr:serine/threonine protein phosphatase [Shimia sp. R10_1]
MRQLFVRDSAFPVPKPDAPICVVGDVHGCLSLFEQLLQKIPQDHQVILAGDYIDRGEQSAGVLRELSARTDVMCLMGNHEEMLLRFLLKGAEEGGRWIHNGGLETLVSFGLGSAKLHMSNEELNACRDALMAEMGAPMVTWLAELESAALTGNVLVSHAGANPHKAPNVQSKDALRWGHPDFLRSPRKDGIWVVHGHTIVKQARAERGRIAVDTGAYASGVLSAVCLDGGPPRFITAQL